jgi:hypothetical protein
MKTIPFSLRILLILIAGLAFASAGCDSQQDSPEEVREIFKDIKHYTEKDKSDYRRALEERLEIFSQKLDELKERAGASQVANLREQAAAVMQKLDKHADARGDDWNRTKKELESTLDALIAEYRKVEASCR